MSMQMFKSKVFLHRTVAAACTAAMFVAAGAATARVVPFVPSPFSFNLVALGNVGTSTSPKTADVQGTAAIVGNLYGSGWSAGDGGTSGGYSLYVGGSANFAGGSIGAGGMQVGGDLTLNHFGTSSPIVSGDNLHGTNSGTLSGQVTLAGTNQSQLTITGQLNPNTPFNPAFNPTSLVSYFNTLSSHYAQLSPTVLPSNVVNKYSTLTITASSPGVQVVDLNSGVFGDQTSVDVKFSGGTSTSDYLIINVPDSSLTLHYLTFNFSGISASHVLVNAYDLKTLTLSGGGNYNLLAPLANTDYSTGAFDGNLIVHNLKGGGESDLGDFFNAPPVAVPTPEPGAIGLLAIGAVGLLMLRKRA